MILDPRESIDNGKPKGISASKEKVHDSFRNDDEDDNP